MSSFIGAALPWMGGKVCDLLGLQGDDDTPIDVDADEAPADTNISNGYPPASRAAPPPSTNAASSSSSSSCSRRPRASDAAPRRRVASEGSDRKRLGGGSDGGSKPLPQLQSKQQQPRPSSGKMPSAKTQPDCSGGGGGGDGVAPVRRVRRGNKGAGATPVMMSAGDAASRAAIATAATVPERDSSRGRSAVTEALLCGANNDPPASGGGHGTRWRSASRVGASVGAVGNGGSTRRATGVRSPSGSLLPSESGWRVAAAGLARGSGAGGGENADEIAGRGRRREDGRHRRTEAPMPVPSSSTRSPMARSFWDPMNAPTSGGGDRDGAVPLLSGNGGVGSKKRRAEVPLEAYPSGSRRAVAAGAPVRAPRSTDSVGGSSSDVGVGSPRPTVSIVGGNGGSGGKSSGTRGGGGGAGGGGGGARARRIYNVAARGGSLVPSLLGGLSPVSAGATAAAPSSSSSAPQQQSHHRTAGCGVRSERVASRNLSPGVTGVRGGMEGSGDVSRGVDTRRSGKQQERVRPKTWSWTTHAFVEAGENGGYPPRETMLRAEEEGGRVQCERLLPAPGPGATVSNWPPHEKHVSPVAKGSLVAKKSLIAKGPLVGKRSLVANEGVRAAGGVVSCGMTTRRGSLPPAFVVSTPALPRPSMQQSARGEVATGDGRESPGDERPSSSLSLSSSASSVANRTKSAAGGRLAWCGDQRLLPRPSATLQLRRHNSSASSSGGSSAASQSTTAAAYLGRLDLSADSTAAGGGPGSGVAWSGLGQLPVNGGWGNASVGGEGYVRATAAAADGGSGNGDCGRGGGGGSIASNGAVGASGAAVGGYSADDAVTLSSSGLSVTSGEESDGDEVFMEVDDRDDPNFDYGLLEGKIASSADASTGVDTDSAGAGTGAAEEKGAGAVAGVDLAAEGGVDAVAGVVTAATEDLSRDKSTAAAAVRPPSGEVASRGKGKGRKRCAKKTVAINGGAERVAAAAATREADGGAGSEVAAGAGNASDAKQTPTKPRSRRPAKPVQPPSGPRKWPPRPPHRALVYAAAAEASRRARGFTGWVFPGLPPPPPPPPRPPTPPPQVVEEEEEEEAPPATEDTEGEVSAAEGAAAEDKARRVKELSRKDKIKLRETNLFLGFAKDNPPGKPSPNELGWLPMDPMLTREGRAAVKKRALERRRVALERVAERKRQEILEALRIKEEIAEARRKRKLNILFLGMTRVAAYDSRGGLAQGMKRFDLVEKIVRSDVDETNMNPLRDTARVLAMEALGHEVRCISKVSTPGESDSERSRSTRAKGAPTGLGRFLATDITNTGASRGFLRRIEEKWENITFDTVLLDHYWLPDSVVWLNKGYMANDGGLIQNLVRMTTTKLLREDFEIMLPINQAFFELLLPHFHDLETHFTVEFLVGERLEHLKRSHIALEADELIPAEVMLNTYGKEREHQVSQMLGVKQPTTEVAAVLLKYGVASQHFCYARFLKLSRNPPPKSPIAGPSLAAAAAETAKIMEESSKILEEAAKLAEEIAGREAGEASAASSD